MIWRNYKFIKIKPVHLFSIVIVLLFFNHFVILSGDNVVYGIGEIRSEPYGAGYIYLNGKGYNMIVINQQDYEFSLKLADLRDSEFVIMGEVGKNFSAWAWSSNPGPGLPSIDIFYVKKPFFLNNFWFNYILDLCVKLAPLLFMIYVFNKLLGYKDTKRILSHKIKIINFRILFLIILGMVGSLIFYLYSNNLI